jgi:hypothetical protein
VTGIDIVLLSYDEPLAGELHTRLERVFGRRVKRLHGVAPMRRALKMTAELVDTEQYWLADGDFEINLDFDLDAMPPLPDGVSMAVLQAVNAINGLVAGYGGLKLMRTAAIRDMREGTRDVLAALDHVDFIPVIAGVTRFNQTPFHTWRAGFREVAMLAHGSEYGMDRDYAQFQIDRWCNSAGATYASFGAAGAIAGVAFAQATAQDPDQWQCINDPSWLHREFTSRYPNLMPV